MLFSKGFCRFVGVRYLRAKKGSSFLSVITVISVGGVAVGVLTMVVILSVMAGFEHEMKERLFQAETHIRVEKDDQRFQPPSNFVELIRGASPLVRQVFPVLQTEVILRSGRKVSGAVLKGIQQGQFDHIRSYVTEWAPAQFLKEGDSRILLGQELAFDMGVIPGDRITAVSPLETDGPFGSVPRLKRFVVEGVYKSGVPEQELHDVFTPVAQVESFLREQGQVSHFEITVRDLQDATEVAQLIAGRLGQSFLVRSWQDLNAHLFSSLRLERTVMFFMLIFIIIVASFNILSMLTMTVIEKKRSLSILRAMGATRRQIGKIVLWQGLAIGLVGTTLGGGFGLIICGFLKKYPIIELPDFYYDRTLPVLIQPGVIATVVVTTLLIVLIGAYVPARKASALTPLTGIREL